jgi:hypothetical protein
VLSLPRVPTAETESALPFSHMPLSARSPPTRSVVPQTSEQPKSGATTQLGSPPKHRLWYVPLTSVSERLARRSMLFFAEVACAIGVRAARRTRLVDLAALSAVTRLALGLDAKPLLVLAERFAVLGT